MRAGLFAVPMCLLMSVFIGPGSGFSQQADSIAAPPAAQPQPTALPTSPPAPGAPPPARKIPGITAPDEFPKACVSCHINMPDRKLDTRLSTLAKGWTEKVEPALLEKAKGAAPAGAVLRGKHPPIKAALRDIPAACIKCHGRSLKKAPVFGRMMHRIHLTGGDANHFMTLLQGECTHCHKLDTATGVWSIPSAPEP